MWPPLFGATSVITNVEAATSLATLSFENDWASDVAGTAGLEPVTSAVTGQRSNQLSYVPQ